tara:strand:+ start:211 stop:852 length:642 start_codon:yes stop_codon:yes gene_type:complete
VKYEGYTEFESNKTKGDNNLGVDIDSLYEGQTNVQIEGYHDDWDNPNTPAFFTWNSMNWHEDTYCGWKTFKGEQGHNTLSTVWETRWWHSIQPAPYKYVGGPYRAALSDFTLGFYGLFFCQRFVPITDFKITYDKAVKVGDTIECVITNTIIENDTLKQELIQRIYGSDKIVGRAWSSHFMKKKEDYKEKQQDLTELNGDGNRDRGRYGEDVS